MFSMLQKVLKRLRNEIGGVKREIVGIFRGGRIRIEAPDAEKLVNLYRAGDEKMLGHFRKFRQDVLVKKFGSTRSHSQ